MEPGRVAGRVPPRHGRADAAGGPARGRRSQAQPGGTCHPVWSEQGGAHRPGSQALTLQQRVEGRLVPCSLQQRVEGRLAPYWEPVLPPGDWGPRRVPGREGAASRGGHPQENTSHLPSPVQAARPWRRRSHRGRDSCAARSQPGSEVQTTVLPVASIPWLRPCWSLELVHIGVCDLRPTSATDWGL